MTLPCRVDSLDEVSDNGKYYLIEEHDLLLYLWNNEIYTVIFGNRVCKICREDETYRPQLYWEPRPEEVLTAEAVIGKYSVLYDGNGMYRAWVYEYTE